MKIVDPLIVRSSLDITLLTSGLLPDGGGSGCVVFNSRGRFLLTVAHVTNYPVIASLDTWLPSSGAVQYKLGALKYFRREMDLTLLSVTGTTVPIPLEYSLVARQRPHLLDLAIVRIPDNIPLKQVGIPDWAIPDGDKNILSDRLSVIPNSSHKYACSGSTNRRRATIIQGRQEIWLSEPTYLPIRFLRAYGDYYIFEAPKKIEYGSELIGTSGSPIMDEQGNIVALMAAASVGTRTIFGFALAPIEPKLQELFANI